MWTALKMLLGGAARAVVKALWVWLQSEAGKFSAEYLVRAKPIVRALMDRDDLDNSDKFKAAASALSQELKAMGVEHHTAWINQTVEIAVNTVRAETAKAIAKK